MWELFIIPSTGDKPKRETIRSKDMILQGHGIFFYAISIKMKCSQIPSLWVSANYKNRHTVVLIKSHQKEFLLSHDTGERLAFSNFISKSSMIQRLTLKDPKEHNTKSPSNGTDSKHVWKKSAGEGGSLILPFAELHAAYPFNLAIRLPLDLYIP